MAEASVASPGSTADSGKKPAIKNTNCKYCGVPFTTSSLGRHLDLYVREKNPKPPDGVHDVDEIRQLRGNVTRRHAKSSTRREGSTPSQSKHTPNRDHRSPSGAIQHNGSGHVNGAQGRPQWNRATWQATGVINGLPPMTRQSPSRSISRADGPRSNRFDIAVKEAALEEKDRALAVELALKEVLGSFRAASNRARPPAPFTFDFFRLNFPGLCLRCMPPPRSLSSHHSNLGQEGWPLEPPGAAELEYMKRFVFAKLQEWKAKISQEDSHDGAGGGPDPQLMENLAKEELAYQKHLTHTYQTWQDLSQDKKQDQWRLQCQKAYADEYGRHQDTRDRLDILEQEIHHLRDQLDLQTRGHSASSSFLDASSMPLSRLTMDSLTAQQARDLQHWDYDRLLDKWKQRIRQDRSVQHPLPTAAAPSPRNNNRPTNGHAPPAFEGTLDEQQQACQDDGDQEIEDEDLADAPGDEDEDEDMLSAVQEQNGRMARRDVLDPNLRDSGGKGTGLRGANGNGATAT
ncbi:MAG: hypothetical protein Q9207_000186 [Kuettlingeria erythrocarpa]